jgi:hypothetical protein
MRHDQLSKSLIATFFADFLCLAAPDSARRLRAAEVTFLDKEIFTDWPTGHRRELDLLARVPAEHGDLQLLVHIEIETRARSGMDLRLWSYYMQLRLRHRLNVLPILVNLRGGRPGPGLEALEEGFDDPATAVFRYRALGLSGCLAEDWLSRPEPLAWAFAALMRPGRWERAELKLECLRRIGASGVAGLRKEMLVNWVESYVKLREGEAAQYRRLLELEENREIKAMELTWLGKAEARGMEIATQNSVERMRQAVLRQIEQKFGRVPKRAQKRVAAIKSIEPLAELVEKILVVRSLKDLGLS